MADTETTADRIGVPPENKQVSVQLPTPLADRLEAAANDRDVSKSRLVARAVEKYLDVLPPVADVLP